MNSGCEDGYAAFTAKQIAEKLTGEAGPAPTAPILLVGEWTRVPEGAEARSLPERSGLHCLLNCY